MLPWNSSRRRSAGYALGSLVRLVPLCVITMLMVQRVLPTWAYTAEPGSLGATISRTWLGKVGLNRPFESSLGIVLWSSTALVAFLGWHATRRRRPLRATLQLAALAATVSALGMLPRTDPASIGGLTSVAQLDLQRGLAVLQPIANGAGAVILLVATLRSRDHAQRWLLVGLSAWSASRVATLALEVTYANGAQRTDLALFTTTFGLALIVLDSLAVLAVAASWMRALHTAVSRRQGGRVVTMAVKLSPIAAALFLAGSPIAAAHGHIHRLGAARLTAFALEHDFALPELRGPAPSISPSQVSRTIAVHADGSIVFFGPSQVEMASTPHAIPNTGDPNHYALVVDRRVSVAQFQAAMRRIGPRWTTLAAVRRHAWPRLADARLAGAEDHRLVLLEIPIFRTGDRLAERGSGCVDVGELSPADSVAETVGAHHCLTGAARFDNAARAHPLPMPEIAAVRPRFTPFMPTPTLALLALGLLALTLSVSSSRARRRCLSSAVRRHAAMIRGESVALVVGLAVTLAILRLSVLAS